MCSIRNGIRAAVVLGTLGLVGCQEAKPKSNLSPLNDTPLIVDEAMQTREGWDRSSAYYPSGATVSGGTGYVWETHSSIPAEYRRFADAPVAVLNFVSLPVGLLTNTPLKKQLFRGEMVPPTFHANPPIPGNPQGNAPAGDAAAADEAIPTAGSAAASAVAP